MDGSWRKSTWGDEITLEYGKALRDRDATSGSVRVFGTNGPIGWTEEPLSDGPGVILGRKGATRGVEYSPGPFHVIDTAYYVVPKTDLDMRWLYYAIKHHRLGEIDDGSPIPSTTRSAVYVRGVDIPPLHEQRRIAHILGSLDDKIELNRRTSQTLEEMARALFKSWFVDFDPVRAKAEGRDTGLPKDLADLFPDRFVDSGLGPIPEGWEEELVGDHVECVKGRSYKSSELDASDTALVTLKSFMRGGGYRPDGLKPYAGSYKPSQVVKPGDLIVAATDVTQAAEVVGKPALVESNGRYATLVASLDVIVVEPKSESVSKAFLYWLFSTDGFTQHARGHSTGTTVLHLAPQAVPNYSFARPPRALVDAFSELAETIWVSRDVRTAERRTLVSVRETLLPRLMDTPGR